MSSTAPTTIAAPPTAAAAVAGGMDKESKEVYDEYLSSLSDLNVNSKPLINMLTILAEENIVRATVIVQAVDHHIAKVPPDFKLPILYLIDSIVKNVGRDYKTLFSQCIVSLFCGVFDVVNEKIREKMYNLRTTWNEVFSQNKLYALDVKVNCIDPNWPITAKVVPNRSPAIHVNPNFFNRPTTGHTDMQQQLRDKERELLELQKKKLELELAATKKRIEEQEKQLNLQTESVKPGGGEVAVVPKSAGVRIGLSGQGTTIPSAVTKPIKINPVVNPALVSSLSSRDPRLMRQQQQQQQREQQNQLRRPQSMLNDQMMRPNMPGRPMMGTRPQQQMQQQPPIIRPHINPSRFPMGAPLPNMPPNRETIQKLDKIPRLSSRGNEDSAQDGQKKRDKSHSSSSKSKSGGGNSSGSRSSKYKSKDESESSSKKNDKYHDKKKSSSSGSSSRKRGTSGSPSTKDGAASLSPKKNTSSPSTHDDKPEVQPTTTTTTSDTMPSPPEITKFKDIKSAKGRNYSRRNRNASPEPVAAAATASQDVDLRTLMPEKKARLDAIIDDRIKDLNNASGDDLNEQKTIIEASAKDVDLRQLPPSDNASKKRASTEKSDEPNAKKSKSEKIDILFGSEDVDLRTLPTAGVEVLTAPPPPMISQSDLNKPSTVTMKIKDRKSRFEEVRAKLAEATKAKKDKLGRPLLYIKLPDDPLERRRRISTPSKQEPPKRDKLVMVDDENSQESYTTNMKTIITQAQEQLDSKEIDKDQYETLVKQVLQINEKRQIAEMQRKMQEEEGAGSSGPEDRMKNGDGRGGQRRKHDYDERAGGKDRNRPMDPRRAGPWANKPWDRNPSPPTAPWSPVATNANVFDQSNLNSNRMLPPMVTNGLEPVLRQPLAPAPLTETKSTDIMRSINIDGVPREIRFYEETAIIVIDFQDLREIGFQMGQRRVTVDDTITVSLDFNDNYKPFMVEGKTYQIRFGAPTRELYIDGHFYECYFGPTTAPLQVMLADGKMHKFDIEGPPPQVKIGNRRPDLVVGMCNMVVDAKILIPLFLDGTQQVFEIDGKSNVLQFADFLLTVLINNEPHSIEFGGFPKSIRIQDQKHFIRFTALPKGFVAGKSFIKHMRRTDKQRDLRTPPPDTSIVPMIVPPAPVTERVDVVVEAPKMIDASSLITTAPTSIPLIAETPSPVVEQQPVNYQITPVEVVPPVAVAATAVPVTNVPSIPGLNNLNIEELYQKLLTSGILGKTIKADEPSEEKKDSDRKRSRDKEKSVVPVRLSKPESIKKRQSAIVTQLFSGMQCSSCGVRFPPEQTMRYSQHLDWHFRQNRRDRDSARRAHSRKWYYDVSDWIQYEEIEDLEEREKNWFETQQNEAMDVLGGEDSNRGVDSPIQSCPAGPDGIDKQCQMCHDQFEHFYNEETEEWHLKSAIMVDDVFYHPLCYEDYKASLTLDESAMSTSLASTTVNNEDDDVEIIGEGLKKEKTEVTVPTAAVTSLDDEDDDVIALPTEEPVVTEILDDEEETAVAEKMIDEAAEPEKPADEVAEGEEKPSEVEAEVQPDTDPDVMIKEPIIETHDVDEYVPKSLSNSDLDSSAYQPGAIKIKEEPKDDGYEDDGFEDVGTFEASFVMENKDADTADDDSQQPIEVVNIDSPSTVSHAGLVTTIDGNVDIQETAGPVVTNNKIRINITKSKQPLSSTTNSNSNLGNKSDTTSILDNPTSTTAVATNSSGTVDSTAAATAVTSNNVSVSIVETTDVNIEYELKESLKKVDFKKIEAKRSGFETSGLCSIM